MLSWQVALYCYVPLLNGQKEYFYRNCAMNFAQTRESSSLHVLLFASLQVYCLS